jgi:hypothetical protein
VRCKRMRGYGSWSIGWREGERQRGQPLGDPGCGMLFLYAFLALVVFCCLKVTIETGNFMGVLIGLAVVAGLLKK